MPGPVIRAARGEDVEDILEFWRQAAEEADRPGDSREAVSSLLDHDPEALILAVEDGRIVGSVIVGWDGWRGHVYRLAVAPSRRRTGLGSLLLELAESRARERGCARVDAIVLDDNQPAQRLWATAGYDRQGRWSRWVKQLVG